MKKLKDKELDALMKNKDYDEIKNLLSKDPFISLDRDSKSITLIEYLCCAESDEDKEKSIELLKYIYDELLEYAKDCENDEITFFDMCSCCYYKKILMRHRDKPRCHPLYAALYHANGNYTIVDFLLEHGANINIRCEDTFEWFITNLFEHNKIGALEYLARNGFNFNNSIIISHHYINTRNNHTYNILQLDTVMVAINNGARVIDSGGFYTFIDDYTPLIDTKDRIKLLDCIEKNGHDLSMPIYYYGAVTIESLLNLDDLNVMKWLYENKYLFAENNKLHIRFKNTDSRSETYQQKLSIYGKMFLQIMKDDNQTFGDKYTQCLHGQYFDSNIEYLRPFYIYDKSCIDKYTNSLPEDALTKIQEECEKIDYTEVSDILLDKLKEKSLVDDIINDKKEDDYIDLLIKHS